MTIIRIGLDTSKNAFHIHGVDENEKPVLRRQLRRSEVEKFFAQLPPTRIGIEACGAAHPGARLVRGLGHAVLLMPPQYIKGYVKRGKNDAIDAEAICEAMSRPTMRLGPDKHAEQQAALTMLGVRDLLIKQRTMLINALRGHAAEFGVTAAKGPNKIVELLQRLATGEGGPALAREMLGMLASQLEAVNGKLKAIEARLVAWDRQGHTKPGPGTISRGRGLRTKNPGRKGLSLGPALCGVDWDHAARELHGRQTPARQDQPPRRRKPTPAARARRHRGHPAGQKGARLAVALGIAGAQAKKARSGRAGQQNGPRHLGHDDQRRGIPASTGGLSPPATDT